MPGIKVDAARLRALTASLIQSHGASGRDAAVVADSLVRADLEGVGSHGVMLLPMYLERIRAGSVSLTARPRVVQDLGGLVVMSAERTLGQVSSQEAVELAIGRAKVHGVAVVTVRDAFHFGTAAYWTRQFASVGMVGMAFSNTRPLMPAPGGAERIVGNNPLSMAFPSAAEAPLVIDMAMSATAMGKIRLAQSNGREIPAGWATDASGVPTTSPEAAIAGMLLPAAGPKGFGLAVAIDLLCGALSGGGVGASVQPLYGDASVPYNCAHTFLAIDASRTQGGEGIGPVVDGFAEAIRRGKRADGVQALYAPGDLERERLAQQGGQCELSEPLFNQLNQEAARAGLSLSLPR